MKKVEVNVHAVSWSNGKPLKWRAMGTVTSKKETKHLFGDPASTQERAWDNLIKECDLFASVSRTIRAEVLKQQQEAQPVEEKTE